MPEEINIVNLIEQTPLVRLNENYQGILLNKIQNTFSDYQKKLFVASFYCYLNYNDTNDFVINLNDIWEWVGFSRKDNAKTLLEKNFKLDIDYKTISLSSQEKKEETRGRKEENIMLTVRTFKKFCLKARTKKADEIHEYYIDMEKIVQETVDEQTNELRIQLEQKVIEGEQKDLLIEKKVIEVKQKDLKIETITKENEKSRHDMLLEKMQRKNAIYLIKVYTIDDDNYVIKFGETKNISKRIREHFTTYGNPIILDVFEVIRREDFETFLKNEQTIKSNKFRFNGDNFCHTALNCTELVKLSKEFTYNDLLNIINENICSYQYTDEKTIRLINQDYLENKKIERDIKKLDIVKKQLDIYADDKYKDIPRDLINNIINVPIVDNIVIDESIPVVFTDFSIPKTSKPSGQRIQKICPETFEVLQVYECMSDLKEDINGSEHLKKAVKKKTIYKKFRWNLLDRDLDPYIKYDIGETVEVREQNTGFVAKLNNKKTTILNVYETQESARIDNGYKSKSPICLSIQDKTITQNHYYELYENLPDYMREIYENEHGTPSFISGERIEKICSIRNERVQLFRNKKDCYTRCKIGPITLNKYLDKDSYKGFYYKTVLIE
jgi:hypothetical protein